MDAVPEAVVVVASESEGEVVVNATPGHSRFLGSAGYVALVGPRGRPVSPRAAQLLRAGGRVAVALLAAAVVGTVAALGRARWPHGLAAPQGQPAFLQQAWAWQCAADNENCWTSKCCKDPAKRCYAKDKAWAQCKPSCLPGTLDPTEPQEMQRPWTCALVKPAEQCSPAGANCTNTQCCIDPSLKCFYKDPGWASCMESCVPGHVDASERKDLQTPWSCLLAGTAPVTTSTTPSPVLPAGTPRADRHNCSADYENCHQSRCCRHAGSKCYRRDASWSECRKDCPNDDGWSCWKDIQPLEPLIKGPRTCSEDHQDCRKSRCCRNDAMQCFKKDGGWSECRESCPRDAAWACSATGDVLKPALTVQQQPQQPQVKIFCFSLMLPFGSEVSLIKTQLQRRAGVFACDGHSVFSNISVELSPGPLGRIATEIVPGSLVCAFGGEYNTALNSEIFVRVWDKVITDGKYLSYDWTVKLDPDAVFIPSRLRDHVHGRSSSNIMYLNNCDEGLHGPVEVLSLGGMKAFSLGLQNCRATLQQEWMTYGEDVWLRRCMGLLGISRQDDYLLLREKACKPFTDPIPCVNAGAVSFHPLKTPELYVQCLTQAGGLHALG